jgi:hypothetical protein
MVKTESKSSNDNNLRNHGVGKLQAAIIFIMAISMGLTFYINIISTSSAAMDVHHYSAAVNQAIEDFKHGALTTNRQAKNIQPLGGLAVPKTSSQAEQQQQQQQQQKQQPKSKIATLSCESHGGPPDEFAQEMIYWQDVPEDQHYVSPFKQKKGEQRRYMTFEPDGGEISCCVRADFHSSLSNSAVRIPSMNVVSCRRLEQHSHGHGNSSRLGGDHGKNTCLASAKANVPAWKRRKQTKETLWLRGLLSHGTNGT